MHQNELTSQERQSLRALILALEEFRRQDPVMPLQAALTFLYVAWTENNEGVGPTTGDIAITLGMAPSSASRNLAYISDYKAKIGDRVKDPGLGLITLGKDPSVDSRATVARLQHAGKALLKRLLMILEGADVRQSKG